MVLAICLTCGDVADSLDAHDAHRAVCQGHPPTGPRSHYCPTCFAAPGEPCLTGMGNRMVEHHVARSNLARNTDG